MSWRAKLSKENADRLAAGKPMKMLRGRVGWHLPGMDPPPLRDIHPAHYRDEDTEAFALIDEARRMPWFPDLIHIPNEGGKGIAGMVRSKKMKAQGAKEGVADYLLSRPSTSNDPYFDWHGLWIELKSMTGKPTDEQVKFLLRKQEQGYACCFAYTAAGAMDAIQTYLGRWPQ